MKHENIRQLQRHTCHFALQESNYFGRVKIVLQKTRFFTAVLNIRDMGLCASTVAWAYVFFAQ